MTPQKIFVFFACVFAFANCPLCAQGVGSDGAGNITLSDFGEVDLEKTLDSWGAQERLRIISRLELQIEQIKSICSLPEEGVKKLNVAVRGVASKRIADGRDQLELFIYRSKLLAAENDREDWIVETEKRLKVPGVDLLVPFGAASAVKGAVEFETRFSHPIENHPLWRNSVKRALTPSQTVTYEKWLIQRNESLLNMAVDVLIATLDSQLLFSEKQTAKIDELLKNKLKTKISESNPTTIQAAQAVVSKGITLPDAIESLLTKPQREQLETFLDSGNRNFRGVHWGRDRPRGFGGEEGLAAFGETDEDDLDEDDLDEDH